MAPRRKVTLRQMELLLEFVHSHRDIALGRPPPGPRGVRETREAWRSISASLNCILGGARKTSDQWRRYWIEYKAKTKSKAADSRRSASRTGGGPNKLVPLNYIEKKVLALLGPVVVEGLPGVRLPKDILSLGDPLSSQPSTSGTPTNTSQPPTSPKPSSSACNEQAMKVEWLDDCLLSDAEETQPVEQMPAAETVEQKPAAQEVEPPLSSEAADNHREGSVPRWAFDMELRRIQVETRLVEAVEGILGVLKDIRDDYRRQTYRR
nr:uncharacterized protein LOC110374711 isoform X2 [Helicoverpa armigera]XP_021188247.2 uncharacterized protein LOC110374711 isoform X2 [Helicoverpa armigera]XP_049694980.1 uncharacterized protein LOC110374711 isoform X2 [Helicoverpa armigera]XP_049694981.1 uncharacterized protein LOC110374711 isoform X2 [Helicoverpa armigera]